MTTNEEILRKLQKECVVRIVDDDEEFLNSLYQILTLKGWYVRRFYDAVQFLKEEDFKHPGCLILDIRMPGMTGLQLQQQLENVEPALPILFLTGHGDVESAVHTLKHGAFDFFQKPVRPSVILEGITKACERSLKDTGDKNNTRTIQARFDKLTAREKEIFIKAANGVSNKEIASQLNIAVPTVKMHRANAFDKMAVHSSLEASKIYLVLYPGEA